MRNDDTDIALEYLTALFSSSREKGENVEPVIKEDEKEMTTETKCPSRSKSQ